MRGNNNNNKCSNSGVWLFYNGDLSNRDLDARLVLVLESIRNELSRFKFLLIKNTVVLQRGPDNDFACTKTIPVIRTGEIPTGTQ